MGEILRRRCRRRISKSSSAAPTPDSNGAEPGISSKLATLDFYDPDAVYVNDARDPDTGIHRGIEAVRRQVGRWVETYPDLRVEPLEIQINGDRAFVWVRFSGHGAESGVPMDMELAHVVTIKHGKVLRVEEYADRADGLEAAGLSEWGDVAGERRCV